MRAIRPFNIYTPDEKDSCTGYGAHNRVMACCPNRDGLYCRVDHVNGLPDPTIAQILTAAKKQNGTRGHWEFDKMEKHDDGLSIDYFFAPYHVGQRI